MTHEEHESPTDARTANATAAERFALLWDALTDVLGTAATATLLRRAVRGAGRRAPLDGVVIERRKLSYGYTVPLCWQETHDGEPLAALGAIVDELRPLLLELTGALVIRRLERLGALPPHSTSSFDERHMGDARA